MLKEEHKSLEKSKENDKNNENELKNNQPPKKKKPTLEDFDYISTVGKGAYGEVVLIQKKENKYQYAMKIIDKAFLFKVKYII